MGTGDDSSPLTIFRANEISYARGVGADGGAPWLGKVVDIGHIGGGYLHLAGGVLGSWKQPGEEVVFVVSGHLTLTHLATGAVYEADPGDVLFMWKDVVVTFVGDEETRIAYASNLASRATDRDVEVTHWKASDIPFHPVGPNGTGPFLAKLVDTPGLGGGYLDFRGAPFDWTAPGEELVWVVSGGMRIAHGDTVEHLQTGDIAFLRTGAKVRFEGDDGTRIAFVVTA